MKICTDKLQQDDQISHPKLSSDILNKADRHDSENLLLNSVEISEKSKRRGGGKKKEDPLD